MCWYIVVLDGEIAHLGVEPLATKALAESSAREVLARRSAEGLGFPHALLEVPEPIAPTPEARWYVLEIIERIASIGEHGPFDTEAEARAAAVSGDASWALLRVCGLLRASRSKPRRRSRNRSSRAHSHQSMARLHGVPGAGARGGPGA